MWGRLFRRSVFRGHEWYHVGTVEHMAMTLRTDPELDAALTALSERLGVSKQEVVRRVVLERHEQDAHRARVRTVAAEAITDYQDALDRLGSV